MANEENKDITILMEKFQVNPDVFLFKPISILKGKYDEKSDTFTDEYGSVYYYFQDANMIAYNSAETHAFAGKISEEMLQAYYPAKTLNDSIQIMFEHVNNTIWLGYVSDDNPEIIELCSLPAANLREINTLLKEGHEKEALQYDELFDFVNLIEVAIQEGYIANMDELLTFIDEVCYEEDEMDELFSEEDDLLGLDVEVELDPFTEPKSLKLATKVGETKDLFQEVDITDMYNYITDVVIGQDEAVRQILTTFLMNKVHSSDEYIDELSRILLTGPTGCGKTLIIETMLEYLSKVHNKSFPFAKVPTSQITVAGYVGMDLEDILLALINSSKSIDLPISEKIKYIENNGIVFLDEIDKKGGLKDGGDVSGRGVLNSLLEFLTGTDYKVNYNRQSIIMNTKNLTIFAAGAFTNVYKDINKTPIGFNFENKSEKKEMSTENFINEGGMPAEFMGRFHKVVTLNPININTLKEILLNSKKSTLKITQNKLQNLGVNLICEDSFINRVAEEAYKRNLGARSLKSIIEESLFEIQWEALKQTSPTSIIVNAETVDNPKKYTLKKP